MNPWLAHAAVVALGVVAVAVGSPLVRLVFARADRRPTPAAASPSASSGPSPSPDAAGDAGAPVVAAGAHLRGGAWIGSLERLAVFVSLLLGWPEGIAVALAVKGLARYPELRATTSGTAERFIIGTFTSVLWAAACAGAAWWVLGLTA